MSITWQESSRRRGSHGNEALATKATLRIDIVVPSYRPSATLLRKVASLRRPVGVDVAIFIVVDRPGTDIQPLLRVASEFKNIMVLTNDATVGASESRNIGINAGSGEYVLLLDDDVEPHEDLLCAYVSKIKSHKENSPAFV